MTNIDKLMKIIGYNFRNKSLIKTALTHSSFSKENKIKNNERLEFLGDRVLGLIISSEIFKKNLSSTEGELAKQQSFLVCKATLKKVANNIKLREFVNCTQSLKKNSLDSVIANTLEALIAAIYLDSNLNQASKIVLKLWKSFLENINLSSFDPKSKLQEWSLKNKKKLPTYEIMDKSGPDHSPTFTIKVILDEKFSSFAKGKSKQDAEIKAANKLLKKICE